jgi:hypothetical protein
MDQDSRYIVAMEDVPCHTPEGAKDYAVAFFNVQARFLGADRLAVFRPGADYSMLELSVK